MEREIKDPHQKALALNLDKATYGTIAEIGAGQETARWFFRVGGAAGTIAKAMSAYSMKFSDAIYGTCQRYVSRDRLRSMLDLEYRLLLERLDDSIGEQSTFFAFANTVAARSFTYKTDGHGWLGILFQRQPKEAPSRIDIHVSLHGKQHVQDHETLGVLGVNLIYGAMRLHNDPEALLRSLLDQLYSELVEIDMVEFSGPAFAKVDNRLMALRLVQHGLSNAAMFTADGHVAQISDTLYKKAVLLERSRFRPPTKFTLDLLDCAQKAFMDDTDVSADELIELSEMTLTNLSEDGDDINVSDFLCRADILCALGKNVLISNYGEFYRLAQFLFRYTNRPMAFTMGLPSLREIFNEKYYEDLPGGILESFGRMFKHDLRLYVSPAINQASGKKEGVHDLKVDEHLRHLYLYLLENNYVKALDTVNEKYLRIFSHEVLYNMQKGHHEWESMVPKKVGQMIKEKKFFDWCGE
jgi:hypothetical protein